MRIVSPYRDYYDVVQSTGQDQSLLYVRSPQAMPFKKDLPELICYYWNEKILDVKSYIIGFCGEIYPVVRIGKKLAENSSLCYNLDDIDKFIGNTFKPKEVEGFNRRKQIWKERNWGSYWNRKDFESYFKKCEEIKDSLKQYFIDNRSPIFIITTSDKSKEVTFNACLRDFEFFRIVDPFTAFQEIAMFMSNLANPMKEIPVPSDKDMVSIKGFDKYSFRKSKS